MKIDRKTYLLVLDLRNALAGAGRVMVATNHVDEFLLEMKKIGFQNGIGDRAGEWLKEHQEEVTSRNAVRKVKP